MSEELDKLRTELAYEKEKLELEKQKAELDRTRNALKSSWKTTEFWFTVLFTVANAFVQTELLYPDASIWVKLGALVANAMTIMGYSNSRGLVKMVK